MSPGLQQAHHHLLRAVPLNITVVQVYNPMSDYDDNEIEEVYDHLQNVIYLTLKKDILVAQKWARMLVKTASAFVDPSAVTTQVREDSDFHSLSPFNDVALVSTFGHHKASRRWT